MLLFISKKVYEKTNYIFHSEDVIIIISKRFEFM